MERSCADEIFFREKKCAEQYASEVEDAMNVLSSAREAACLRLHTVPLPTTNLDDIRRKSDGRIRQVQPIISNEALTKVRASCIHSNILSQVDEAPPVRLCDDNPLLALTTRQPVRGTNNSASPKGIAIASRQRKRETTNTPQRAIEPISSNEEHQVPPAPRALPPCKPNGGYQLNLNQQTYGVADAADELNKSLTVSTSYQDYDIIDPYATTASPTSEPDSGLLTDDLLAPTTNVRSLQTLTSSNSQGRKELNEQPLSSPTPLPKHVLQTMPISSPDKGTPFGLKPTVHVEGPASGDALGNNTKAIVGRKEEEDGSEDVPSISSISISFSLDAGTS